MLPKMADVLDSSKEAPQNICKYCKKTVTSSCVKCILCNVVFHTSCALRISGLTAVGRNNLVECCKSSARSFNDVSIQTDVVSSEYTDSHYREIINSKEEVIQELKNNQDLLYKTVSLLEDKIMLLKANKTQHGKKQQNLGNNQLSDKQELSASAPKVNKTMMSTKPFQVQQVNETESEGVSQGHREQSDGPVSCEQLNQAAQRQLSGTDATFELAQRQLGAMNRMINLAPHPLVGSEVNTPSPDGDFSLVQPKKRRLQRSPREVGARHPSLRQTIKGTAPSDNDRFTAIPVTKRAWFHVANFHPDLGAEELTAYLNSKYHRDDFQCFKINPKHRTPRFSSFKVGGDVSLRDILLEPGSWNAGISVCKFDFFRAARNKLRFDRSPQISVT